MAIGFSGLRGMTFKLLISMHPTKCMNELKYGKLWSIAYLEGANGFLVVIELW